MPKPPQLTGGSRKGKPNRVTKELKEMILTALDGAGGVEYLQGQAKDNPVAFLTLIGKVLPLTVKHSGEVGMTVTISQGMANVG